MSPRTCRDCGEEFQPDVKNRLLCPTCRESGHGPARPRPPFSCGTVKGNGPPASRELELADERRRALPLIVRRCCPVCQDSLLEDIRNPKYLRCQRETCGHLVTPSEVRKAAAWAAGESDPAPEAAPEDDGVRARSGRPRTLTDEVRRKLCTRCGHKRGKRRVPTAAVGLGLCAECAKIYRTPAAAKLLPQRPCLLCRQPTRALGGFCRTCASLRFTVCECG